VKVYKISAITLSIKNMEKSCKFYSRIPGFKVVYGRSNDDTFTTFKIGEDIIIYLNLELRTNNNNITTTHIDNRRNFTTFIKQTKHEELKPMGRQYVHLSVDRETAAGSQTQTGNIFYHHSPGK
jgi:catechol 2,3-dioxygenase-like lactoylglutathione lyase family enzyme